MRPAYLDARQNPDRPCSTVTLRLPDDVIADMQRIALYFGCSGHIALMRFYIGQGLRASLNDLRHANSEEARYAELEQRLRENAQAVAEIQASREAIAADKTVAGVKDNLIGK